MTTPAPGDGERGPGPRLDPGPGPGSDRGQFVDVIDENASRAGAKRANRLSGRVAGRWLSSIFPLRHRLVA